MLKFAKEVHIYLTKFNKYDSLVSEMRYHEKDFSVKEVTKIKYKETEDINVSYKYLNNTLVKKQTKH